MEIVYRNIAELHFSDYNPRHITEEQFHQLKASLSEFGLVEPAVVNMHQDRENILVGGEQRVRAATALGHELFPCIEVVLDLEAEKELNVRLNKNRGKFDYEKLLKEFTGEELLLSGFNEQELQEIRSQLDADPKGLDAADAVYKYDLIFDSPEQLERFKAALANITSQVKRTEQTTDLLNFLNQ